MKSADNLRARLHRGEPVIGSWINSASPIVAELMAAAGFDFLLIENEHWPTSLAADQVLIRAARAANLTAITRVPDAEYHLVARTLDTGARGIIVPRVNSPERAAEVVSWAHYPPEGTRGYGPGPLVYDYEPASTPELIERVNANTLVVVQAESRRAIECIDELAAVPGLDAIMIGPADLSISLGIPGDVDHPDFVRALERVVGACAAHGIASGMFTSADRVRTCLGLGMRLFCVISDLGLLRQAALSVMTDMRAAAQEAVR
jgi:2-keto-3-deoxy-L-rhamnonate aldolase RhmA